MPYNQKPSLPVLPLCKSKAFVAKNGSACFFFLATKVAQKNEKHALKRRKKPRRTEFF